MSSFDNRIQVISTDTGTGNLTIDSTVAAHAPLTDLNYAFYYIVQDDSNYEVGIGSYAAGDLVRSKVIKSSNSNNLVNWSAGQKKIFVDVPANIAQQVFNYKTPVLYATASNINIASVTTIDGHTCATGERFLLLNQTDPTENGIYTWVSSTLIRANDYYSGFYTLYSFVYVINGTYAKCLFLQTAGVEVDVSNITFTQVTPTGTQYAITKWATANSLGTGTGWLLTPTSDNDKLAVHASYPTYEEITSTAGEADIDLDISNWFNFSLTEDTDLSIVNADTNQGFVLTITFNTYTPTFLFNIDWAYDEEPIYTGEEATYVFLYKGLDAYSQPLYKGYIVEGLTGSEPAHAITHELGGDDEVDHDALLNFVANEHIDHSSVSITAGAGLSGGGNLTTTRTLTVDINGQTNDASPDLAADYVMTYDASAAGLKKVLLSLIGTGKWIKDLPPSAWVLDATSPPESNSISTYGRPYLGFDASTIEIARSQSFGWRATGTITAYVFYFMASATSGTVQFDIAVEAITVGDALDVTAAESFDTVNSGSVTVPATLGYVGVASITLTNKDSVANGDHVRLRLRRKADAGANDSATGDARVLLVALMES